MSIKRQDSEAKYNDIDEKEKDSKQVDGDAATSLTIVLEDENLDEESKDLEEEGNDLDEEGENLDEENEAPEEEDPSQYQVLLEEAWNAWNGFSMFAQQALIDIMDAFDPDNEEWTTERVSIVIVVTILLFCQIYKIYRNISTF